jgi:hypothetical protein
MSGRNDHRERTTTRINILGRNFYIEDSDEDEEEIDESERAIGITSDDGESDDSVKDDDDTRVAPAIPTYFSIDAMATNVGAMSNKLDSVQEKLQEIDTRTSFLSKPVKIRRASNGRLVMRDKKADKPGPPRALSAASKERMSAMFKIRSRVAALFDQLNDDEGLRAICGRDLATFEYEVGIVKYIHVGLVFGTLDRPTVSVVLDALRQTKSCDSQIDGEVMDAFWKMTYDGNPCQSLDWLELHYHLVLTVLDVLREAECDPAYLAFWEYLLGTIIHRATVYARMTNARYGKRQVFSKLIEPICNKRLSPLVSHLSLTETMQVLKDNPYWLFAERLCLVMGVSPTNVPWQLNLAIKDANRCCAPEQASWLKHLAMPRNMRTSYRTYHDVVILKRGIASEISFRTSIDAATINCLELEYLCCLPDLTLGVTGFEDACADVHSWLIASVWPYIVVVLTAGMAESRDRVIHLPADFPRSLLSSILCRIYGSTSALLPPTQFPHEFVEEYEDMYGFSRLFEQIGLVVPPTN